MQGALAALDKSLAIAEAQKNNDYIDLALQFYLNVYREQRDIVKAEAVFRRRLELAEAAGPTSMAMGVRLWDIGDFYRNLGQYERAEAMLKRALSIFEKGPKGSELNHARAMMSLAEVHRLTDRQSSAEELLKKAIAMLGSASFVDKGAMAAARSTLAVMTHQRGDFDAAIEQFKQSCATLANPNPWEILAAAQCNHNLGLVHISKGDFTAAKTSLEAAAQIWTKYLGADHPYMTYSLSAFAQMYDAMGDWEQALSYMERTADIADRDLEHLGYLFSEAQKRDFVARLNRQRQTEGILSFAAGRGSGHPGALRLALRTVLRRKGKVLDAMVGNSRFLRGKKTPEERKLIEDLLKVRAELSRLLLGGAATPQAQARVRELQAQLNQLEEEIARRLIVFRGEDAKLISLEQVQKAVPEGALLIEIAKYRPYNGKWRTVAEAWRPARYMAFLLAASGEPEAVDLGEAASLDDLVLQYRRALSDPSGAGTPVRIQLLARQLDERIFRPIAAKGRPLPNPKMIFVSPDGLLNTLPLGALIDENGRFRIESYPIVYLTTGRELLRLKQTNEQTALGRPVLIANPTYGESPSRPAAPDSAGRSSGGAPRMRFPALPGTEQEAKAIRPLIPGVTVLENTDATEAAVRNQHAPILLHIATHGFFLGEAGGGSAQSRGLELFEPPPDAPGKTNDSAATPPELSLALSGLAFAGANKATESGDDGLLTALEAAALDLSGTELVVMSACETGLGGVGQGEGIYGLRRALVIAGARSQMMSLWKVDDDATRDLMIEFYRGLSSGEGRAEALRDAQISLLKKPAYAHPYFWASFIHSGDFGPVHFQPEPPPPKNPPPAANSMKLPPASGGCGCEIPGGADISAGGEEPGRTGYAFAMLCIAIQTYRHGKRQSRARRIAPMESSDG